jgi:hypothetical protein
METNTSCSSIVSLGNYFFFFFLGAFFSFIYFIYFGPMLHRLSKMIWFLVFNTTFSNISAISWRPVLVVEKPEYPERTTNHGQATGKHYHLRLRVECTLFCNLQSWVWTHAVLVIGLYELLGNPTTKLIQPPGPLTIKEYPNSIKSDVTGGLKVTSEK